MKTTHLLYVALLVAVAAWFWLSRSGGAEAEIRARLEMMEQLLVKQAGESALDSADRARRFADFLGEEFVLRLEPINQEIRDPAALARPFVGLRRQVERLEVDFADIEIDVEASGRRASSTMYVSLHATGANPRRGRYQVTILWVRAGDWRIEDLHAVETLRGGLLETL